LLSVPSIYRHRTGHGVLYRPAYIHPEIYPVLVNHYLLDRGERWGRKFGQRVKVYNKLTKEGSTDEQEQTEEVFGGVQGKGGA
jgi:hypothetical protein